MAETRRLFIGLAVPMALAEGLHSAALAAFPPAEARYLRFTAARDLHVTLLFLGSVAESAIPALEVGLGPPLSNWNPLELELDGMGAFPARSRPRTLWAGVRAAHPQGQPLEALRAEVVRAVHAAGVAFSVRGAEAAFRAHITLARVPSARKHEGTQAFFELDWRAAWRADEVVLFESTGQGGGGGEAGPAERYLKLRRFPLLARA